MLIKVLKYEWAILGEGCGTLRLRGGIRLQGQENHKGEIEFSRSDLILKGVADVAILIIFSVLTPNYR